MVWFWNIVGSYSEEMRARLLQFVTGSSRVPLQGFKALQVLDLHNQKSADFFENDITIHLLQGSTGAAGPRLFTLHLVDVDPGNLPKAHTCFNRCSLPISRVFMVLFNLSRLDLPPYPSEEKMMEKLTQAVEETCGFAVE